MTRIKLVFDRTRDGTQPPRQGGTLAGSIKGPRRRMRHAEIPMTLEGLLLFTVAIRVAAHFALAQPLVSDSLAYLAMAKAMAAGYWPADNFGQHAFYSIGYPLVLTPFFALFGATAKVALGVNLILSVVSALLVAAIARALGYARMGEQFALLGHAVWLPGIWNGTMLARENLSTPLLLAVVLLALHLLKDGLKPRLALAAGAAWGAAVLAGGSALPLIVAPLLAIALAQRARFSQKAGAVLAMAAGAALLLGPWLAATNIMVGRPVVNTNAGFNLYLGNNPAATGTFVSIADTPVGPHWHQLLAQQGEAGASATLSTDARQWIAANPAQATHLAARKLTLFWWPNLPKASDFTSGSKAVALVRLGEVAQYVLFVALGIAALVSAPIARARRLVLAATIAGFWALHGAAYIIPRYRDPVMPLLILLAAGLVAQMVQERRDREALDEA